MQHAKRYRRNAYPCRWPRGHARESPRAHGPLCGVIVSRRLLTIIEFSCHGGRWTRAAAAPLPPGHPARATVEGARSPTGPRVCGRVPDQRYVAAMKRQLSTSPAKCCWIVAWIGGQCADYAPPGASSWGTDCTYPGWRVRKSCLIKCLCPPNPFCSEISRPI
jgi:hypothetical protein